MTYDNFDCLLHIAIGGCFPGFTPFYYAEKCFYFTTGRMWWGAQADCQFRTGYTVGHVETRNQMTLDYIYSTVLGRYPM